VRTAICIIFVLFVICFVAIVVEELFIGGRRRRQAEKLYREKVNAADTGNRA